MATNQQQVVVGVFQDRSLAERAVDDLKQAGFREDQIGFAVRGDETVEGTTTETAGDASGGAVTGAVSGGLLGGIVGAAAALLIPGIGPVIAGGILGAALTGAAVGAATGGLLGALTNLGVPEEEAQYYQSEFEAGRTIVTLKPDDAMQQQEAMTILRRNGAYDAGTQDAQTASTMGTAGRMGEIDMAGKKNKQQQQSNMGRWEEAKPQYRSFWQERYGKQGGRWEEYEPAYRYGWEMRNNPQYANRSFTEAEPELRRNWEKQYPNQPWNQVSANLKETWDSDNVGGYYGDTEQRAVPIREEQLYAEKQPVQTGEVYIGKEVVTEEKTINVPVTREQVYVEERSVQPRPSDQPIREDEAIRVPVMEEQVRVSKQPVVTGEVLIGKEQVQENQQVSDTVRREEAHIERQGNVDVEGTGTHRQPEA